MQKLINFLRMLALALTAARAGVELGLSLRRAANPALDEPSADDPAADQPQGHLHIPEGLRVPDHLLSRTPRERSRTRRVDRGAFGVQDVETSASAPEPGSAD